MENRPLRVPATEDPRFFNRDSSFGFSVGYLASLGQRSLLGALALPIAGIVIGGTYGKEKMQREQREGKLVHPPSFFGKGTVVGITDGLIFGSLFTIVSGSIVWPVGLALALGTLYSANEYRQSENAYAAAKRYVAQFGEYNPRAPQHVLPHAEILTPEESMLLQERLAQEGKHRSHAAVAQLSHAAPHESAR